MGLFLRFKKNEGMYIETNDGCIDLIVRNISGPKSNREVDFEVKGIKGLEEKHISCKDGLVKLTEGITLGIRDKEFQRGGGVDLHYKGPFKIERLKYS